MKLFVVSSHDNGLYAFHGRSDVPRCASCRNLLMKWETKNIRMRVPTSLRMDISATYDGVDLVSSRFVDVCEHHGFKGLVFHKVCGDFSALIPSRRVAFDSEARQTEFVGFCTACGQYDAVAGATPAVLRPPVSVAPDEFVWTDVEFGSGDEKSPLLICGDVAASVLRGAKLKGLAPFLPVRVGEGV